MLHYDKVPFGIKIDRSTHNPGKCLLQFLAFLQVHKGLENTVTTNGWKETWENADCVDGREERQNPFVVAYFTLFPKQ